MKSNERESAIALRRQGLSYREVREQIPVAKSTLSLWFRDVQLSKRQHQRLTDKKKAAQLRGARTRHEQRLSGTEEIMAASMKDIRPLTAHEKLIIGAMLYWAEGSKEKEGRWGSRVQFGNSDPRMAKLFQRWLVEAANIDSSRIKYEIYIHDSHAHRVGKVCRYWAQQLDVPIEQFQSVYFKRHKINSNRKNQGNGYYGLVRLTVRSSSILNRRISGWIEGVVQNWGIV